MYKKYVIKYRIIFVDESTLENKEIKIAKCYSGAMAQIRLEEYLKRKHTTFKKLEVTECKEDISLDTLLSQFGDIFGGNMGNMFGGR
jgi:hypothetical protein